VDQQVKGKDYTVLILVDGLSQPKVYIGLDEASYMQIEE
jgi:hypothetical protein